MTMTAIKGVVRNGRVEVDVPVDWPEGCEVILEPVPRPAALGDEDAAPTPEVIAARLALMDQLRPGWLSPEDDAAWRTALRDQRESEKARFFEDADQLRRMWE